MFLTSTIMLPFNTLPDGAAPIALSAGPEKASVKPELPSSLLPCVLLLESAESSENKRLCLPEPAWGLWVSLTPPWCRGGTNASPKAIHWLWDQDAWEKASTLFGGLPSSWILMGSTGSAGRVMGALWARAGMGLTAWKAFSGESHGEDVDEETVETSLDRWLSSAGGERSGSGTVSAEGADVIKTGTLNNQATHPWSLGLLKSENVCQGTVETQWSHCHLSFIIIKQLYYCQCLKSKYVIKAWTLTLRFCIF